ncbi:DNA-3-methyladenine glycosylase [Leptolinea tardivitalis]|uniref:DNA-3-methyladenine glycosylase n=1 Tax=Leptolinea tardivitalis TaxID=229920 RepID=UPI00191C3758|nr:DNA-3-methyladenine glycosylase [Leptolinea tardivitalis]
MTTGQILPAAFYDRSVVDVAHDLLGKRLVRVINGQRISGIINETEAYDGEQDQACHAKSGKTARNYVMYGRPGRAYVYFTYGMHWMLNCVCGPEGYPAAVLIRSLIPDEGLDFIACKRQGISQRDWCSGPARLTRALAIGRECNEVDLTGTSGGLFIEESNSITEDRIHRTPRIGIQYAGEPWVNMPWRFVLQEST